ncbi:hypothetical protein OROGR_032342 [Orobanche gracilis]
MCSETKRKRKRKRGGRSNTRSPETTARDNNADAPLTTSTAEEDVLFSVDNLELIQSTASPSSSDHCGRRRGRPRKTSRTDNSISATNGITLAASVSAAIANGGVPTALINEESAVARVLPAMDAVVKVKLKKRGSDTKYVATVLAIGTEYDIE